MGKGWENAGNMWENVGKCWKMLGKCWENEDFNEFPWGSYGDDWYIYNEIYNEF
jgi:hypothetical protein